MFLRFFLLVRLQERDHIDENWKNDNLPSALALTVFDDGYVLQTYTSYTTAVFHI